MCSKAEPWDKEITEKAHSAELAEIAAAWR
jgi:hypothetical protein